MQKKYILPVVGQIYKNRNGREYCCLSNVNYTSESSMCVAVSLGEHQASMIRFPTAGALRPTVSSSTRTGP